MLNATDNTLHSDEKDHRFLLIDPARAVIDRWNAFVGTEGGRETLQLLHRGLNEVRIPLAKKKVVTHLAFPFRRQTEVLIKLTLMRL